MSEGSNGLIENVMQYTASGTIAAAALGYQMLSTIVGDLGVSSPPLLAPASNDKDHQGPSNIIGSTKAPNILTSLWRRRSSNSQNQYSSAGFDKESSLPLFTLQDVSFHDMSHDCWIILYDRVYDVTTLLDSHPGGDEVMLEYAGLDATLAFRSVGHSKEAEESLKPYLIGILVENERIWTRFFNMKSDIP